MDRCITTEIHKKDDTIGAEKPAPIDLFPHEACARRAPSGRTDTFVER